jgi:predicted GNAT family acetyltransferase
VSDYLTNLIGQQRPKNTVPVPTSTPALKLFPNSLQDAGNELLGNLGIAGRGLVQGAVSPITMVADPLTEFVNKTFGAKEKLPSQAVSEGLTALGVPQAKDNAQRILEAATGGLAGGGAIAKTAQLAGKGAGLAKGYLDTIGKDLAGQMTSGLGSGAGSVGATQAATASGASPVVAQLAGLGGGIVGGGARPVGGAKSLSGQVSHRPEGSSAFESSIPKTSIDDIPDKNNGMQNLILKDENGEKLSTLTYSTPVKTTFTMTGSGRNPENYINIEWMDTPDKHRGKGYATELAKALKAKFPDKEIIYDANSKSERLLEKVSPLSKDYQNYAKYER